MTLCLVRVGLATALITFAMISGAALMHDTGHGTLVGRVAGGPSVTIVAVISPLPDEVSNGTWSRLDATGSTDSYGLIVNYTWDVLYKGTHTYTYESATPFKFMDLGLYQITLTVTDDQGNYSKAFTAVYSIIDSDSDSLPDWWEIKYFHDLNQTGSGDFDRDGYTNLEEYAAGQDPTVKDPAKGLMGVLQENWMYLVAIAAAVVAAVVITIPRLRKKRNAVVKKKIEAAIEIEKALESEK